MIITICVLYMCKHTNVAANNFCEANGDEAMLEVCYRTHIGVLIQAFVMSITPNISDPSASCLATLMILA